MRIAEPSVRFTVHTIESLALGQLSHLCIYLLSYFINPSLRERYIRSAISCAGRLSLLTAKATAYRDRFAQLFNTQVEYNYQPRKRPLRYAMRIAEPSVRFTVYTIESLALGRLSHLCTRRYLIAKAILP